MSKLEWECSQKQIITPTLDSVLMTDKWHKLKMAEYSEKFGITAFQMEGDLGARLEHSQEVSKAVTQFTSTATYQGKVDGLSITFSKV